MREILICATKPFETTEQYRLRVEQNNQKPLFGSLTINSTFAFVSKVNDVGSQVTNLYNADKQIMTYSLKPERSQNIEIKYSYDYSEKENCFQLDLKVASSMDYVGTNSYGIKTTVRQSISYISSLTIENWNQGSWGILEMRIKG